MNIFRQRERQLDLEDDERELEEWREEVTGKWGWVNLGNVNLVWIAEVWMITATEAKKSIVIASPMDIESQSLHTSGQ